MSAGSSTLRVSLWRGAEQGRYETYNVPRRENQTVLDVVTFVQRHLDPTLSYRFACRVGMCGSLRHDGQRPAALDLPHARVEGGRGRPARDRPAREPAGHQGSRDATCAPFFEKWQQAKGVFAPSQDPCRCDRADRAGSAARIAADAAIECINCGVCYAACDTVRWNDDYLGPAALNRAWTLVNDERDAGNPARLAAVAAAGGCHACHSHQSCQEHCPQTLNPTASIAGLKRRTMQAYLKGELKG